MGKMHDAGSTGFTYDHPAIKGPGGRPKGKGNGGIDINPANKGKFTAKAKAAGKSVQGYASEVMDAPKGKFSGKTRQEANFAKNAKGFKH